MRYISWNVNGIRAARGKGFLDWLEATDADVVAVQEIKARPDQLDEELLEARGYHVVWNPAERPGYSGTATFSRRRPRSISRGFDERFDDEGRVTVTQHGTVALYNVYFPNGGRECERVPYKLEFYDALLAHVQERVASGDKVVVCGDWNTAHREIDLARPKPNRKTSGFLPVECDALDRWVDAGWVDAFRHFHPETEEVYSWWSQRFGVRAKNIGWRIDYHLVSPNLAPRLRRAEIWTEVHGSDHCPVVLDLR